MSLEQPSGRLNKLLEMLPDRDFKQISPKMEFVTLPRDTLLSEAGKPIDHVYFLTDGIGSVFVKTPEGRYAEAGIFGFEGYIPTSAVADVSLSTFNVNIQIEAKAYRIPYDAFRKLMRENQNFSTIMIRAIEAFAVQLAYTAVSNAAHDVNERLARWILMCHDRVSGDELHLTHEFISLMLSVRRPSVTTSLHVLEGNGFIRAERGLITVRKRAALEDFARDAYGKPEEEYKRLMADLF
jgi:CRP-like cAMP-binding protein